MLRLLARAATISDGAHRRCPINAPATLYLGVMTAQTDALRSEVLALPEADRAQLAVELLDSLDDRPVETDQAELDRLCYIEIKGERVYLRSEGRPEARRTVRRHRLAERLMMDILDVKGAKVPVNTWHLEHGCRLSPTGCAPLWVHV